MVILDMNNFRAWVKKEEHPVARTIRAAHSSFKESEVPVPFLVAATMRKLYVSVRAGIDFLSRALFFTPMFRSLTSRCGKNLYLYGGLPYVAGPLNIEVGDHCRISGKTTFTGRYSETLQATLKVGDNVDIGWQCTLAVGRTITFGDNVRIAGSCFFAGYPGHPIDAFDRALGGPDLDSQAKDITLEHDVWVGTGSTIVAGVTIGRSSIVAAGSVVTKSFPANVLIGGNPARVIKNLNTSTAP